MNRRLALLALVTCAACYSKDPSIGLCNADPDCVNLPDGGHLAGAFCNSKGVCEYACSTICDLAAAGVNAVCVLQGPKITMVNAPATWAKLSGSVVVTAVVDDTGGPGIASATLRINLKPDIAGTTSDTGPIRTYSFTVAGSVQTPGSEVPVSFSVIAADSQGGVTPDAAAGTGQLRIDDSGPTVGGVTVNGGVAVGQIKWFPQSQATPFTAVAAITDNGSGLLPSSVTLTVGGTRIDSGTPTCVAASGNTMNCTFSVVPSTLPTSVIPATSQRQLTIVVAGTDAAGNSIKANTAAVGVDGKPPAITFTVGTSGTTTTYPPANANCNGNGNGGRGPGAQLFFGHQWRHLFGSGGWSKLTL